MYRNIFSYEQSMEESLEYFNGDNLAATVFIDKYALRDKDGNLLESNPSMMLNRIAKEFARIEKQKFKKPLTHEEIFSYLDGFKRIIPQGSPLYGIGNSYQNVSIANCFVAGTEVMTLEGKQRIEDIKIGDLVLTKSGKFEKVLQKHITTKNIGNVIKFKCLKTPSITCTENHKFWSISKEQLIWGEKPQWNSISYLRKGDYIAIPEKNNIKKLQQKKESTHQLKKIDGMCFVRIINKERVNDKIDKVYNLGINNDHSYIVEGLVCKNCFSLSPPYDSYGGIHRVDQQLTQISKRRGGVGIDISTLRPNGTPTTNAAKTSTGIVSFMERYSNSIREVGQCGRRGALGLTISVHHPEVLAFIKAKTDLTKITGANISVRLTDEFLQAVSKDKDYEQRWPVDSKKPKISRQMKAKEVWMQIVENARNSGEPGILFWDQIIRESPADCYSDFGFKSIGINPCAELILCGYGSCILLLLNLFGYVTDPFTENAKFDFNKFYQDAQVAQRLIDDMIDLEIEKVDKIIKKIESDPEPDDIKAVELNLWKKIKDICIQGRRTGTGTTALGDTLAALGIVYGSEESIGVVEKIYQTLKLGCYRSSVNIAKELGAFPVWNYNLEKNNPFLLRIKDEDPELWADMKKYGRRNIALLTNSPSGSVSTLSRTTSGIEPLFQMEYTRRKKINPSDQNVRVDFVDKQGDSWQEFKVIHPTLELWKEITGEDDINKSPYFSCCAKQINWINRVKIQAVITKNICHNSSSTVNLPEDISLEEVAKIYETAWKEGLKGITVYREGSRDGVLINKDKTSENKIIKTTPPKRPKELPCDVHHLIVKGEEYIVLIGLLNNEPYEVFASKDGQISKNIKGGILRKAKRGCYQFILDENVIIENIMENSEPGEEAVTRLVSTSIRHGTDIEFIVDQLEKGREDLYSFEKALARSLKKYIADGTIVSGVECERCSSKLIRENGCVFCKSCGWSKC